MLLNSEINGGPDPNNVPLREANGKGFQDFSGDSLTNWWRNQPGKLGETYKITFYLLEFRLILQAPPALITWMVLKAAGEDRQPARTCSQNESGKCLVVSTQLKPITPKNINQCHLKRDHVNRFQTSIFQRDMLYSFRGSKCKMEKHHSQKE